MFSIERTYMIEINIPLQPVPWQAPIRSKKMFFDPKEKDKRAYRYLIKEQYKEAPLTCYTICFFRFVFLPPTSYGKQKCLDMLAGRIIPTKCDTTNLQKLAEDCLKGIVIDDDRKVAKIFSEKMYGEKTSVYIRVFTLEEFAKTGMTQPATKP